MKPDKIEGRNQRVEGKEHIPNIHEVNIKDLSALFICLFVFGYLWNPQNLSISSADKKEWEGEKMFN